LRTLGRIPLFSPGCRFHQETKNRISWKIKSVTEVSKVPLKIQNNSRKSKTIAGNSNRSAERWAFRWKFGTAAEQLKSSAEKLNVPLKICNVRGKFKSPAGGRTSPAKI
jgi:hypothetical protein